MSRQIKFEFESKNATTFEIDGNKQVWLSELFGLCCGFAGQNNGPARTSGLTVIDTSAGRFEAESLKLVENSFDKNSALFTWHSADDALRLDSQWFLCSQTGIWSRQDTIHNISKENITVFRCLARFVFSPGFYEFYSQSSNWCCEDQGIWQQLHHGSTVLSCQNGRTTQGNTPYMCLRNTNNENGVAFHILPRGNWVIKLKTTTAGAGIYSTDGGFAVVEIGLSDESLRLELPAGDTFELPEVLIQSIPSKQVETAAPNLHNYILNKYLSNAKPTAAIVYNTWFDVFDFLNVERLRKQLAAAKQIGCEVFVVDAGWYGSEDGNWEQQVGDWRERPHSAFKGHMADFADEVRKAGLGFGLWMEPERNCPVVPTVKEHPDWFLRGSGGCFYPDLTQQQVYDHILAETSRLLTTYQAVWMKIDFNFELNNDPTNSELANYYSQWYKLVDELREKFPDVFFENCSSGGARLEINSLRYFDGHFLSDNTNPTDTLRIYQQALLRLPPGRIISFFVLRTADQKIPQYGLPLNEAPTKLITPAGSGATWDKSETTTVDFGARSAMLGMFGLSGDIAGLNDEMKDRLEYHIGFYKKWRQFIVGSTAHLLTPPGLKQDHSGWIAIQLQQGRQNLLFVYRLDDACERKSLRLRGLERQHEYTVIDEDKPDKKTPTLTGSQLMNNGLIITLPRRHNAAIIAITAK